MLLESMPTGVDTGDHLRRRQWRVRTARTKPSKSKVPVPGPIPASIMLISSGGARDIEGHAVG